MIMSMNIGVENQVPKYLQVVNAVSDAIRRGSLKKGQKILSINELSDQYFVSRVTVERAYNVLREKGIIIPIKGKGYYINDVHIDAPVKVLLLFNKISNYKKQIYQSFIKKLGTNAVVDLKIHHFNVNILRDLVENYLNDYNYFVIMPYFYDHPQEAISIIKTIPPEKLILLDKRIPYINLKCAAVFQDFENDIIDALDEALDLLSKYSQFYFVNPVSEPHPLEIVCGFKKFCMQNSFKGRVISEITMHTPVHKGDVFIVIEERDLANLIKLCHQEKLEPGKDIGIISYNETPLKEVLLNGITVISTDHVKMGETAADLIINNSRENIKNPFVLIKRGSL
jgi:DNA-binding transcriptional regulator YhcF (GntR family)